MDMALDLPRDCLGVMWELSESLCALCRAGDCDVHWACHVASHGCGLLSLWALGSLPRNWFHQ